MYLEVNLNPFLMLVLNQKLPEVVGEDVVDQHGDGEEGAGALEADEGDIK